MKVLFPDASLRKLVISELKDQGTSADINDDTIVSARELADITEINAENLDNDDQAVKDLTGIEYLTNLKWLTLEEQDLSDVTNIDWSKLTRLRNLDLAGNLLTKIPNLTKCENLNYLCLNRNKLPEEEITEINSKLPTDYDGDLYCYDQCLNGVQEVTEDTYYMNTEGKAILAFEIEGSRKSNYTVTYYVDGQKIFEKNTAAGYAELAEGKHTTYAVVTYNDGSEIKTEECTFSVVNEPIIQTDTTNVFSTKSTISAFSWNGINLSGKEAAKIVVSNGNTVLGETSEVSSYEAGSYELFNKVNAYISDLKVQRMYAQIKRAHVGKTLPAGSYDVVVTMTDGTTETIKGAITVTDGSFVSYVNAGYGYNNGGEYVYLQLGGNKIDPSKLNYRITDAQGIVKPVTYVNYKQIDDGRVVVKLKKTDWTINDNSNYQVSITGKDGVDITVAQDLFSVCFQKGIYFFDYNSAKNKFEMGYAGEPSTTEVTCEIIENYNSDNVLATAKAEIKDGIAYFVPVKADGSVYVPNKNGQIYCRFTIGKEIYTNSTYYNMYQSINNDPYWSSNEALVSKSEKTYVTRFLTGKEFSAVNAADYSFGLFLDGKQVDIQWNMQLGKYRTGNSATNEYKGMLYGELPLSSLEAGTYTLIAFYQGQQLATSEFQLIDSDKFVLYSKSEPYMSWEDKNHIVVGFTTNCHSDEDDYNITLTDEAGNVVKGLSCEAQYKDKSSNWVSYLITGLNYKDSDSAYYLKITHKTLGDPVDENGKAFYSDEKGILTDIYQLNHGGIRTDESNRVNGVVFTNMEYPVTIRVFSTRDTDVLYQKQLTEAEVSKYEDGTGYYLFEDELYNQIPDLDEKYDISVVDATGAFFISSERYLSNKNENPTKELNISARSSIAEAAVGDKVTITANAAGGTAPYTYSYLVHNKDTNSWARLSGFVKDASLVWTAGSAGNREFFVEVKDSTGKVVRSAAVNVKVNKGLSIIANASVDKMAVGQSATLRAYASDGKGTYTYSYLVHNKKTDGWARLTGFVQNASLTWKAESAGDREFFVEVKDAFGRVVRSSAINIQVASGFAVYASADTNKAGIGQGVVLRAEAVGGKSGYTYSYLVHNKTTDQWARLTPQFVKDSSFVWKTGTVGERELFIEAKDSTGKVVRSSAIYVNITNDLVISAKTSTSNTGVGQDVILSAEGFGGKPSYTYSYLVHNKDTNSWARLTPQFVKNASFVWNAGSVGNREFFIEVKDSTGKVVRSKALNVIVTTLSISAKADKSEITVGQSITLQAQKANGNGTCTYSYLVHNKKTGGWARLTPQFVNEASYTWKAESAGDREFFVEVKDSTGCVVRSKAVTVVVK